jgi:hypothetical protein
MNFGKKGQPLNCMISILLSILKKEHFALTFGFAERTYLKKQAIIKISKNQAYKPN